MTAPQDCKASDDLASLPVGTAEQERQLAKNWMDTAASYARNEAYWRDRARKAEHKLERSGGKSPSYQGWCKLALKGHRDYWGFVEEVVQYGHTFCRLQIPSAAPGKAATEKLFAGGAIYAIIPCSQADVMAALAPVVAPEPVAPEPPSAPEELGAEDPPPLNTPCNVTDFPDEESIGEIHGEEDCLSFCRADFKHHWRLDLSFPREDGVEHEAEKMNLGEWWACLHCSAWAEVKYP